MKPLSLLACIWSVFFSTNLLLPGAGAIVSYGVRLAVIIVGSTSYDLTALRDKIRSTTV